MAENCDITLRDFPMRVLRELYRLGEPEGAPRSKCRLVEYGCKKALLQAREIRELRRQIAELRNGAKT